MERPQTGCSVILYDSSRVLLVKRSKPPFAEHWSLPGGSQNIGETLEACARRELLEETGLTVGLLEHLTTRDYISGSSDDQPYHFVLATFLGTSFNGKLKAGDDALDCAWHSAEDIKRLPTTPGLYEFLVEYVEPHCS